MVEGCGFRVQGLRFRVSWLRVVSFGCVSVRARCVCLFFRAF